MLNTPAEVLNQAPPLEDVNLYEQDRCLQEGLNREGAAWFDAEARQFGARMGKPEMLQLGVLANRFAPELRTHDRFGGRIDEVHYHPAYHELLTVGIAYGVHSLPWKDPKPGSQVARAVLVMLRHQVDEGTSCPLTMTFAAVPSLRQDSRLAAEWIPRILANSYDPRFIPAGRKRGVLFGMGMTEKQGGSDVRANTTSAEPLTEKSGEFLLTGHKWFCSAPMSDAFLILAKTTKGLSCFLVPRWLPDGARNVFRIQRLKDKLGNRSNASSEVEFERTWGLLLGEEGRGIPAIMEMVRHTRLDCALGSAATLRRGVAEAVHHARFRKVFGRKLIDQPLMQNVLADLALESEAATTLALRLARSFDEANRSAEQRSFCRIATAIGKFWITKRTPLAIGESLECIGGNGYVEESPLPRLYRDSPLNSLWEGAGNVQCLDVLRAIKKEPACIEAVRAELAAGSGSNAAYDRFLKRLESELLEDPTEIEFRARRIVHLLALGLQTSLLLRHAPAEISEAFCRSRLAGDNHVFGLLPAGVAVKTIIERVLPA
jgi:putative acyl-CoA dehydrogenase